MASKHTCLTNSRACSTDQPSLNTFPKKRLSLVRQRILKSTETTKSHSVFSVDVFPQ